MFKCLNMQMLKSSNAKKSKCSNVQSSNVQILKWFNVQTLKCSNVQMFNVPSANVPIYVPMFKCSEVQMFRCQMFRWSNIQMSKYSYVENANILLKGTSGVLLVIFVWVFMTFLIGGILSG